MALDPNIKIGSVIGAIIKVINAPGYLIPNVIAAVKALIYVMVKVDNKSVSWMIKIASPDTKYIDAMKTETRIRGKDVKTQ